jgi:imidazole glycerol-phosphate synthase subunit HisF
MLKLRIMPTLLYKDTTLVKGKAFDSWRRVGSLMQAIKVYNMREVDELVFLDITASAQGRRPDFALVDDFADECFMPLTVGGGIRTVKDVRLLLEVGADKVAINTAAAQNPSLITEIAAQFGSQCVVVSIDYRTNQDGRNRVYIYSGSQATEYDPLDLAREAEARGAGEILLTNIDRDGTMTGYDYETLRKVSDAVSVPVIASGGAGCYEDMLEAIGQGHASAVAAASIFHFTQKTPLEAKLFLRQHGINTRV